jgi:calmodulin
MSADQFNFQVPPEAEELLLPEKLEEIKQTFAQLDTNQDGKVCLEEYLNHRLSKDKEKLIKRFSYLDEDQDGEITFEEFLLASETYFPLLRKFKEFDADRDGLLSFNEALQIADALDFPITPERLRKWFKTTEGSEDGNVTYNEYLGAIVRFGFQ